MFDYAREDFEIDDDARYDEWLALFAPVPNTLDPSAGYDGLLFETYGAELEHVRSVAQANPERVWTLLDCDGVLYVGNGMHVINRVGYFITERGPNDRPCKPVAAPAHK